MKGEPNYSCLVCDRTEAAQPAEDAAPKAAARCYFPPKGWAVLYPPPRFPARSGICTECITRAIEEPPS